MNEGEINRLRKLPDNYDQELFNKFYKKMTPLIKNLVRNIDERRFNVDKEIIKSYFYDKLLYVFTKYYQDSIDNPEKFKATIISSLQTFKYRLLRNAYSKQSEYHQSLSRFDDCFDGDKEDLPELSEADILEKERLEDIYTFMKENCSPEAYMLFRLELSPPPFFLQEGKNPNSKLSTSQILDYFEKPKNKLYVDYISNLRKEIQEVIKKAQEILP